jgi:hypothetical protein
MTPSAYVNTDAIKVEYAPYHIHPFFEAGYADYMDGYRGSELTGVEAQAYERGQEAAMRVQRATEWVDDNAGAD